MAKKVKISASEMNALKQRIKDEMSRRSYTYGSLSEFGGDDYDFNLNPSDRINRPVGYDFG